MTAMPNFAHAAVFSMFWLLVKALTPIWHNFRIISWLVAPLKNNFWIIMLCHRPDSEAVCRSSWHHVCKSAICLFSWHLIVRHENIKKLVNIYCLMACKANNILQKNRLNFFELAPTLSCLRKKVIKLRLGSLIYASSPCHPITSFWQPWLQCISTAKLYYLVQSNFNRFF